jgi:hypothetical protein
MILEYVARFIAGGLLVCVFALISQICMPKQFAGIFSAAPSVLLAGLVITIFTQGASHAVLTAQGAIFGALGMIVYCFIATPAIQKHKALTGSIVSLAGWFLISCSAFAFMSVILKW